MCLILTISTVSRTQDLFQATWTEMQHQYGNVTRVLNEKFKDCAREYIHPHWLSYQTEIKSLLLGNPNPNFLSNRALVASMVRSGFQYAQKYEVCFLKRCIAEDTRTLIAKYKEPSVSKLPHECRDFDCSTNALGQLYYAGNVLENNKNLKTIVEYGAGYGCLANIFKQIFPSSTIVLIDLPELLAIQYLYLSLSLPGVEIIMHTEVPLELKERAIHLIPTFFVKDLVIKADLFISTFAISESSASSQKIVCEKNFFDSSICFIVGQLQHSFFENEKFLHESFRKKFPIIACKPFHMPIDETFTCYEMLGVR
jgi:hypothetical protein